jgi:long-chain fatty acid transport protein
MATGAPFGSETQPPNTFAAFGGNAGSDVFSLAATPTVGFKVNDWMSIGAGVTLQYFKVTLKSVAPGPTPVQLKGPGKAAASASVTARRSRMISTAR